MHVIVLGAGEVGSYVAERLSRQGIDVAVIENDPDRLAAVEEKLSRNRRSRRKERLRAMEMFISAARICPR